MEVLFFSIIVLLFSVIIHEIAHGSAALALGDTTARDAGRLSLNPLKHLDPIGSVILPIFLILLTNGQGPIFAWAKPVPINSFNFRDKRWGILKVSIAGSLANFLIGVFFCLLIRFFSLPFGFLVPFSLIAIYNFILAIFNLLPIPPLDGSHILFTFLQGRYLKFKIFLQQFGFLILIILLLYFADWIFRLANLLYIFFAGQSL